MLNEESREHNLPFLVIGGHAVSAYGFSRFTRDVDLLIPKEDFQRWLGRLQLRGFALYHDGGSFMQLTSPVEYQLPLDFMLVPAETFTQMEHAAREMEIVGTKVRCPELRHLLALKIHSLKQGPKSRHYKDFVDILSLAEVNGIDIRSDSFRTLCLSYGDAKIYDQILAFSS